MIFDNLDEKADELLDEFRPKGDKGAILITSRDNSLTSRFNGMQLDEMNEDDAVEMVLNLTRINLSRMKPQETEDEIRAARGLVKRLGYLPFGIGQAAALVNADFCSLVDFLEAYTLREVVEDTANLGFTQGISYRYTLKTVWDMNFEKLSPDSKSLMRLLSFLDPDRIQMRFLREGCPNCTGLEFLHARTSYKLNKCRADLLRGALVSQGTEETSTDIRMHRLVQIICQMRMDLAESRSVFASAVSLIKNVWPVPERSAVHNPSLWETQTALLPHVQKLCEFYVISFEKGAPLIADDDPNWCFASVLYEAGW